MWKKFNGQLTDLWIGDLYEEKNGKVLCHVYAGGGLVATFEPYEQTPPEGAVFYYYHPDHLGSSQLMTNRSGAVVQQYGYSPFGREDYKNNTQAFNVSNRYTGQVLDEDIGLYYYGARYYDPNLARFIQPDSIIPDAEYSQVLNRYAYCYDNPLNYADSTGYSPQWSSGDVSAMLTNPYGYPHENLPNNYTIGSVSDLLRFPEGRMAVVVYLNGGLVPCPVIWWADQPLPKPSSRAFQKMGISTSGHLS